MKKYLVIPLALVLFTIGCTPIENDARDAAAGLGGSLKAAQVKYQTSCAANPEQSICQTINRGVDAQNALVTGVETYCGWTVGVPPLDPLAKCVPVKDAKHGLVAAIANANQITKELQGAF